MRSLGIVLLMLSMSGCVTQGMYERGIAKSYQAGYKDADGQCVQLQLRLKAAWDVMTKELADKNALIEKSSVKKVKKK